MSGEIPAIDGRDIFRVQRTQLARVIPIVKMSAVALEAFHCSERRLQPIHGIMRSQPAKVARRDNGQKIEPHICRRCPMGNHRFGIFLEIVRRKRVILRGDERFKETPSSTCGQTQRSRIGIRDGIRDGSRLAGPQRNGGRKKPEAYKWSRNRP